MEDAPRRFTVERVAPAFAGSGRTHAMLTARGGADVDVLHLWTSDPALADALAIGIEIELRIPERGDGD